MMEQWQTERGLKLQIERMEAWAEEAVAELRRARRLLGECPSCCPCEVHDEPPCPVVEHYERKGFGRVARRAGK
tara:strand:+ start:1827 stop:2048 length:222 start_codon:yes stop_codon:yes gene_type:complete